MSARLRPCFLVLSTAALIVSIAACGGGNGSKPSQPASPGIVVANPPAVAFASVGSSPIPVTVTQSNASGGFTLGSSTCASIASGSPGAFGSQFFVTPIGAGSCALTVNGSGGQTATVQVSIPTPGPVVPSPAAIAFTSVPQSALLVNVSQLNGNGSFTISSPSCASIASPSPATLATAFSVTPLSAGTCSITVTGVGGKTATVGVTVTTTSIINQSRY